MREQYIKPIVAEILGVMLAWDIKGADFDYIQTRTITSLIENTKAAERIVWGKNRMDITMSELDKILRSPADQAPAPQEPVAAPAAPASPEAAPSEPVQPTEPAPAA